MIVNDTDLIGVIADWWASRKKSTPLSAVPAKIAPQVEPLPPARQIEPEIKGTNVIDWAKAFEAAHKRKPKLNEAQAAFKGQPISRSTLYRRLKAA